VSSVKRTFTRLAFNVNARWQSHCRVVIALANVLQRECRTFSRELARLTRSRRTARCKRTLDRFIPLDQAASRSRLTARAVFQHGKKLVSHDRSRAFASRAISRRPFPTVWFGLDRSDRQDTDAIMTTVAAENRLSSSIKSSTSTITWIYSRFRHRIN